MEACRYKVCPQCGTTVHIRRAVCACRVYAFRAPRVLHFSAFNRTVIICNYSSPDYSYIHGFTCIYVCSKMHIGSRRFHCVHFSCVWAGIFQPPTIKKQGRLGIGQARIIIVLPLLLSFSASPTSHFKDCVRISFSYYNVDVLKSAMSRVADLINSMLNSLEK